jgi:hypothetical protein
VDTLLPSSVGAFVMRLFQPRFTAPSWQTVARWASGWALASGRHPIATDRWLTGAGTVTPCSRFSVCLGCPFYNARWQVWACLRRQTAQRIPAATPIVVEFDETTKQKAGTQIAGVARCRTGAGSARQAYRPLRGVHCVLGVMRVPLPRWPGHCVTVPSGVARYLPAEHAHTDTLPDRARRALARPIVDFVAAQWPGRTIRVLAAGGDATKACLRDLPPSVAVLSR